MKELIRIENFNPVHVNGLFNQFECEVIKSGKIKARWQDEE